MTTIPQVEMTTIHQEMITPIPVDQAEARAAKEEVDLMQVAEARVAQVVPTPLVMTTTMQVVEARAPRAEVDPVAPTLMTTTQEVMTTIPVEELHMQMTTTLQLVAARVAARVPVVEDTVEMMTTTSLIQADPVPQGKVEAPRVVVVESIPKQSNTATTENAAAN